MILGLKDVFLSEGTSKSLSYTLDLSSVELYSERPFVSPVRVEARAYNSAGLVELELSLSYEYSAPCDRCGTKVVRVFNREFSHHLAVSLNSDENDDYIETPDFTLELDDLVRADIILDLPSKFLCCDDCKGLCSICGKNLNKGGCSCNKTRIDPRLEVLKQLLD